MYYVEIVICISYTVHPINCISCAVLEGDSWEVFKVLTDEEPALTSYGLLVNDAKVISRNFKREGNSVYSHTKRKSNSVSHSLARYAINIPDYLVWMEDVPPQFHSIVQADLDGLKLIKLHYFLLKKKKKKKKKRKKRSQC